MTPILLHVGDARKAVVLRASRRESEALTAAATNDFDAPGRAQCLERRGHGFSMASEERMQRCESETGGATETGRDQRARRSVRTFNVLLVGVARATQLVEQVGVNYRGRLKRIMPPEKRMRRDGG